MKKIVLLFVALSFVACSSKEKAEAPKAEGTPIVEEKAAGATPDVSKVDKKKMKKTKAASEASAQTTATETTETTTTTSSDSSFPAFAGTEKSSVTCTNKTDSRKISVLNATEGGCGVVYNKAGEDKTVAIAKANLDHCDTVAGKIKTNLEGAGFDCGGGTSAPATTEPAVQ